MITLTDVIGMTGLTEEEVAAIAEHAHLPEVAAAALGDYTMHLHHGPAKVQAMICADIREAIRRGDVEAARGLFMALRHFMAAHPEAARGAE